MSRNKNKLPVAPVKAAITSLTHDGRGVAHVDGKAVFIDNALPGEEVEFQYTDIKRHFAEGRAVNWFSKAPERVDPGCSHFDICGGCSFQHVAAEAQINIKQELLAEQFKRIGKVTIPELWEPLVGPHWGYRRKARMGAKYVAKKDRVLVGFREKRQTFLAELDACPVMHPRVGTQLTALGEMIKGLTIREKIPQIEVAIGDDECILAVRVMAEPTAADQERMREFAKANALTICLQPKGPDTIRPLDGEAEVIPTYALPDHGIEFLFRPAMFTQVNYEVNRQMVNRVIDTLQLSKDDTVLDLFCGLGNFTLPIARYAGHVVGVEGDLPLVEHASLNALHNNITNVEYFVADLSKDLSSQSWANRRFNKIMLDPSRVGASEVLPHFQHWRPERIVYVSCNPSTLARDAGILVNELGYKLIRAGVMDMFPQTAHVESIALFEI